MATSPKRGTAAAAKPALPPDAEILVSGLVSDAPNRVTRIALQNLTPGYLLRVFKASVIALRVPGEAAGKRVLYPEQWAASCERDVPYAAVLEDALDALEDDAYCGAGSTASASTCVRVSHVPVAVDEDMLRKWMTAGLEHEQPELRDTKAKLKDAELRLTSVAMLTEQLPNFKGTGTTAASMLAERERRSQQLAALRVSVEESLVALKAKLAVVAASTLTALQTAFSLAPLEPDDREEVTETRSWRADFEDSDGAQQLALVCVHKPDWGKTWLVGTGATCVAGVTGEEEPPRGRTAFRMAAVRFTRERHGRGMIKYSDARGFVSGGWFMGQPHGAVTQVNVCGKFSGRFEKRARIGAATMVYSRGDTYAGAFDVNRTREHASLLRGDEYADGAPHGEGALTFVDGSRYTGSLRDGLPCGRGVYMGASGVEMEGTFDADAVLHGEGSVTVPDRTRLGAFRRGCAHGEGTEIDTQLGTYEGDFDCGMKHGWGRTQLSGMGGVLTCGAAFDMRHGPGAMDYGTIEDVQSPQYDASDAAAVEPGTVDARQHMRTRYRYYGRWRAGGVRGRGVFTDKHTEARDDPLLYTFAHTSDSSNPAATGLDAFVQRTTHTLEQRLHRERAHATAVREARQVKEHENLTRYRAWMLKAKDAAADLEARTHEQRVPLREMHHALLKARVDVADAAGAPAAAGRAAP